MSVITKIQKNQPKSVGRLSFDSFLEACEGLKTVLDDTGMAAHADRYKVYIAWADDKEKFASAIKGKSSLELGAFHLDNNIVTDAKCAAYFSLYMTDRWLMEYGITDGKKLFMVGRFEFDQSVFVDLPGSQLLAQFKSWFDTMDMREHTVLNSVRRDMRTLYIGPCTQSPVEVYDGEVSLMCMGLGSWNRENGILVLDDGEPQRIFDEFKKWASDKKWAEHCTLSLKPWKDGRVQLSVKLSTIA